jgi:nitrile hydratase subunit beta
MNAAPDQSATSPQVVYALGEHPAFKVDDAVRVDQRSPVGHYRVPTYLRGKTGVVETVITPVAVDNEQEGFGRNAGGRLHYYRISFRLSDIWRTYQGSPRDSLHIEVFETWLERI